MKKILVKILEIFGYSIIKNNKSARYQDIQEKEFWELYELCKPYTMTSIERMYSLYKSVKYILKHDIPGDFVECGVWRGGSSMLIAFILKKHRIKNRKLYLFDTFEGMSAPTEVDKDFRNETAENLMDSSKKNKETSVWCLAELEDVQQNMSLTKLSPNQIIYVKGMVEDTIPESLPDSKIAFLRQDTDFYESTKHELTYMFPLVSSLGVLIIDDYGHWKGCRKAVDEYMDKHNLNMMLHRIDYTGRVGIKL